MHIEFVKNYGSYSPGDTAGFESEVAEGLVDRGFAVPKKWEQAPAPEVEAGTSDEDLSAKTVRGRRK